MLADSACCSWSLKKLRQSFCAEIGHAHARCPEAHPELEAALPVFVALRNGISPSAIASCKSLSLPELPPALKAALESAPTAPSFDEQLAEGRRRQEEEDEQEERAARRLSNVLDFICIRNASPPAPTSEASCTSASDAASATSEASATTTATTTPNGSRSPSPSLPSLHLDCGTGDDSEPCDTGAPHATGAPAVPAAPPSPSISTSSASSTSASASSGPSSSPPASPSGSALPLRQDQVLDCLHGLTGLQAAPLLSNLAVLKMRVLKSEHIQDSDQCAEGSTVPARSVYRRFIWVLERRPDGREEGRFLDVCFKVFHTGVPCTASPAELEAGLARAAEELRAQAMVERATAGAGVANPLVFWDVHLRPGCGRSCVALSSYTPWAPQGDLRAFLLDHASAAFAAVRKAAAAARESRLDRALVVAVVRAKLQQLAALAAAGVALSDAKFENDIVSAVHEAGVWRVQVRCIDVHGAQRLHRPPGPSATRRGHRSRSAPLPSTVLTHRFMAPEQCRRRVARLLRAAARGDAWARRELHALAAASPAAAALLAGAKRCPRALLDPLGEGPWELVGGVWVPAAWVGVVSGVWHLGCGLLEVLEAMEAVLAAAAEGCGGRVSEADGEFLEGLKALAWECMALRPSQRPGLDELLQRLAGMAA
ncbi:hypothetical protein HYH03_012934 [Edaphochlamys debaryana]|uniref:Protein kinase domain-containing protein n=1 Tax=Edaphochlamys debaryana TaxID=47281 RepID=A0A836BTU1_9CHLO|nr:hypothetical protein HYH03_012934 [Edaphochlamys debaryana]|eukprot:KAG2488427.1 hypothetical protein HYH03_012934 [Edaphochlamys debaryana]